MATAADAPGGPSRYDELFESRADRLIPKARGSTGSDRPSLFELNGSERALVRIDDAQVFHDLQASVRHLRDVHVHPHMMLSRHHFGGDAPTFGEAPPIEHVDHHVPANLTR